MIHLLMLLVLSLIVTLLLLKKKCVIVIGKHNAIFWSIYEFTKTKHFKNLQLKYADSFRTNAVN